MTRLSSPWRYVTRRGRGRVARVALTVVGSVAFDSVETPFGKRERMLGGAATHFSLAARFFTDVRVVGVVGDDFGAAEMDVLESRGIDTGDITRVPGGKTFFWAGRYDFDLNVAHTLDTQLNVFGEFDPQLSEAARSAGDGVPREHPARPAALGAAAVRGGPVRRARLDEPVDRHRAGVARRDDPPRRRASSSTTRSCAS